MTTAVAIRPMVVDGNACHSSLDDRPPPDSPMLGSGWVWTPTRYEDIAASIRLYRLPWWRRVGRR